MRDDIIIQNLTEAFEVIKDRYPTKKESIINCIIETEKFDGDLAMDMWYYVLQNNKDSLKTKDGVEDLINALFFRLNVKYSKGLCYENTCNDCFDHLFPYILQKKEIIELIFLNSYDAGYSEYYSYYIPAFIACILLTEDTTAVKIFMESICQNKNLVNITIGGLIRKTYEAIERVYSYPNEFKRKYKITSNVKEVLLSSLNMIENEEDRAECTIAFLSI